MNFFKKFTNYITSNHYNAKAKILDDVKEKAEIIYTDPFPEDPTKLTRKTFGNIQVLDLEFLSNMTNKLMEYEDIVKIQSINQTIISSLDFNSIAQKIVDKIRSDLGFIVGCLFILDSKKGIGYSYTITGELVGGLEFIFGKKTIEHIGKIYKQDNLVVRSFITKKAYIGNDFRDFVSPVLSTNKANIIQVLLRMKTNILVPLIINNNVIGVIMFVGKQKILTDREKVILKIFSNQMAIALHNATLYKEVQKQVIRLQEKTYDLESLLSLSSDSSTATEIEKSIQNILDIVPIKLEHLNIVGAILVRYNKNTRKAYLYSTTESSLSQKAKKLLTKKSLTDYYIIVKQKDKTNYNLTIQSILGNKTTKSDNLLDFISPPVERSIAKLIQKIVGIKAVVGVPIGMRGRRIGVLIFLFTKPLFQIGDRDMNILNAFARHVSVVMDNLHFYHHLNKNIEKLTHAKNKLKEMLSMKNDFLHIVSHQLRTPLTAMRGFISMWGEGDFDALPADKMKEIKARIVNNAERLNNMVNDMVMAMESEGELKINFQPVDLKKLIASNIEMLKSNFEKKNLYLKYKETAKSIPKIEADEKLLLNVFMNLIDNAEKYTDKGGLTIKVWEGRDNVKISFADTGIGLSKEDKKILFKKFSRGAKSNYINPNGSGLGLFIIKQIIAKHHGKIKAASKGEGKGTAFTITLPARQGR